MITVCSFAYKLNQDVELPDLYPDADEIVVVDCRKLRNPHSTDLRDRDGRDEAVHDFVFADGRADNLVMEQFHAFIGEPAHYVVAFGCIGGKHRSVACAEALAEQVGVNAMHHGLAAVGLL